MSNHDKAIQQLKDVEESVRSIAAAAEEAGEPVIAEYMYSAAGHISRANDDMYAATHLFKHHRPGPGCVSRKCD